MNLLPGPCPDRRPIEILYQVLVKEIIKVEAQPHHTPPKPLTSRTPFLPPHQSSVLPDTGIKKEISRITHSFYGSV